MSAPHHADLQAAFDRLRAASRADPFPAWPQRRDRLRRLDALLCSGERQLCDALSADFGQRAATESILLELQPARAALADALRHGRGWMRPRAATVAPWFWPARAQVQPMPLGVVGVIAPWNYPVFLAVAPLAGVFAAGNRAMLKLSEHAPRTADCLGELARSHFDADELSVFDGDAAQAAAFAALPFDHLLFTGSTAIARHVMAAASRNLVPLTLELSGKSPALLAPGCDLAQAARRIVWGKLVNAGQTCVAPDYVLLPRADLDAFVAACRDAARAMFPLGLASPDYCSIIDPRHYARLLDLLPPQQRTMALFDGPQRDDAAHRLAPALVVDPPVASALMQDEIFGPWLPLLPYDTLEQACATVRERPRPLALYWFDRDRRRARAMLRQLPAGGACVNEVLLQVVQDGLPFGGVGASGFGHYHGRWGFDTFSKLMPVLWQSRWNAAGLAAPPYGRRVAALLALLRLRP